MTDDIDLDAPLMTKREALLDAFRHVDMVFAYGLAGITDKLDRDHIVACRNRLAEILWGPK